MSLDFKENVKKKMESSRKKKKINETFELFVHR